MWLRAQIHWTAFADPKPGNVTNTPQIFTFGPQFLAVQAQTLINSFTLQLTGFYTMSILAFNELMETFASPGKLTGSGFKFFSLFLLSKIPRMSFRRFNFMMTFLGEPLEGTRWQSSTKLGSTETSVSSKISKTFDSGPLLTTLVGIAEISRHFL